jgi:hypothetical protein
MAILHALFVAGLISLALAVPAPAQEPVDWYTDTGGGGVLARPPGVSESGGVVAPLTASGEEDVPESDISATPPVASPSDAEERVLGAPTDAPALPREDPPAPSPAQEAPAPAGQADEADEADETIGSLPFTGLQLVVVASAGLILLVAGAALWPRPAARR